METIQEIMPVTISKEDAKKQFNYWTDKLGLVHTFSFDEVYDAMMERRIQKQKQNLFRQEVISFEKNLQKIPGALGEDPFPLEHNFADGLYIRQLKAPPRSLTVTKIHAKEHAFFLMKGEITILTENGKVNIKAPYQGITKAGTKRIIWHHDEVIFVTVHATKETDVKKIEEEVIAKDFEELNDKIDNKRIQEFVELMSKQGE